MKEVVRVAQQWSGEGKAVALATVVRTWGSAPLPAGSKMVVSGRGEMAGSVSAGCVEAAVIEEAVQVLDGGRPRLLRYGVADETAWNAGLTCGGEIEIFVEPLAPPGRPGPAESFGLEWFAHAGSGAAASVRAVIVRGPGEHLGRSVVYLSDGLAVGKVGLGLDEQLAAEARSALKAGRAETRSYVVEGEPVEVLFDPWLPPPILAIVGGVHIAMVLSRLARAIGYRVAIIDPRRAFATAERFPDADLIETAWPDEGLRRVGLTAATAVAAISHDPKLDDCALKVALPSPAFYVGALGSRETNDQRRARLLAEGLEEEDLRRLHAPIGIDLGRQDPEGIALSILVEIVTTRAERPGGVRGSGLRDHPAENP